MNKKHPRILAIAPISTGFGFAVMEGQRTLVDWGVRSAQQDKNTKCLLKVKNLIADHQPDIIAMEDIFGKDSRRGSRTKALSRRIIALASKQRINVMLFTKEKINKAFFTESEGTKYALAQLIAERFPEELTHELPPKRRAWDSENPRMGMFDAVALASIVYEGERSKS